MQTVPSAEMHAVDSESWSSQYKEPMLTFSYVSDAVPADATIAGFAIHLPGVLDDDAIRTIFDATNTIASHRSNPFLDNFHNSQLSDGEGAVTIKFDEN